MFYALINCKYLYFFYFKLYLEVQMANLAVTVKTHNMWKATLTIYYVRLYVSEQKARAYKDIIIILSVKYKVS